MTSISIAHQEVSQGSRYDARLRCLLQRLKLDAKLKHRCAANAFSKCVQIPDELMLDANMNNGDSKVDSDSIEDSDTDTDLDIL